MVTGWQLLKQELEGLTLAPFGHFALDAFHPRIATDKTTPDGLQTVTSSRPAHIDLRRN